MNARKMPENGQNSAVIMLCSSNQVLEPQCPFILPLNFKIIFISDTYIYNVKTQIGL